MAEIKIQPSSPTSSSKCSKADNAAPPSGKRSTDHASLYMLNLHRTNLEVRLRHIDPTSLQPSQQAIHATVSGMLEGTAKAGKAKRDLEWDQIYKAESLIALLFNGAALRQEISARLQELEEQSLVQANALRREYEALTKPSTDGKNSEVEDTVLRMFLLRIMEALHWSAKKKYLARPIRIEATNRILVCMLFSFALLVAPYLYLIWDFQGPGKASHNANAVAAISLPAGIPSPAVSPVADATTMSASSAVSERSQTDGMKGADAPATGLPVNRVWSLFALWTAVTAGLLGAFFSRLMSIQRQWTNLTLDEVFLHREWPYTFLRAGVGVCGALVVYFFLRSGIAEGALFPKFDQVRIELINVPGEYKGATVAMAFVMPSVSLALLTLWCFLAGFSEALVPSVLAGTERQLTDAASPGEAGRPGAR